LRDAGYCQISHYAIIAIDARYLRQLTASAAACFDVAATAIAAIAGHCRATLAIAAIRIVDISCDSTLPLAKTCSLLLITDTPDRYFAIDAPPHFRR
jgi:hypothetical protein